MGANDVEVPGAEPISFYLRNYDYSLMLSDLPILSIGLDNTLERLFWKNSDGTKLNKIMVDSSLATNLADDFVMVTTDGGKAGVSTVTESELSALEGLEGNIQDQFGGKADKDRLLQFFNGTFLQEYLVSAAVVSSEVVISLSAVSGTILSPVFNSDFVDIDFSTPKTVNLTQGTNSSPLKNYVYFDSADLTLKQTVNGFPTDRQICKIAEYVCPTHTKVTLIGSNSFQAINDSFSDAVGTGDHQITSTWIRGRPASYVSGMLTQAVGGSGVLDISVAVGVIRQKRDHNTPAFDTATGSFVQVYNDPSESYKVVSSMVDQLTDNLGNSMSGKSYNLFAWIIGSETTGDSQLMFSLPSGSYNNGSSAILDSLKTTNRTIPMLYIGTATALAVITVTHSAGGNSYTIDNIEDLRGISGAGGGAVGATPPLADTIAVSGDVDISAYGVDDRVMTFIKDGIRRFTVWGDGLVAALKAEIATLGANSLIAAKALIVKANLIDVNIGSPVLKDAVTNIGAGAVIPERYQVLDTELGDLDGAYIEDTGTGELFAGYKSWFISGTDKRLRPVAQTVAGPVFAYAIVEEATPTQYSVIYLDNSDTYFQETPDPDNPDNSSYTGNGVYLGDNAGVVYFDEQTGNSVRVEGESVFEEFAYLNKTAADIAAKAVVDKTVMVNADYVDTKTYKTVYSGPFVEALTGTGTPSTSMIIGRSFVGGVASTERPSFGASYRVTLTLTNGSTHIFTLSDQNQEFDGGGSNSFTNVLTYASDEPIFNTELSNIFHVFPSEPGDWNGYAYTTMSVVDRANVTNVKIEVMSAINYVSAVNDGDQGISLSVETSFDSSGSNPTSLQQKLDRVGDSATDLTTTNAETTETGQDLVDDLLTRPKAQANLESVEIMMNRFSPTIENTNIFHLPTLKKGSISYTGTGSVGKYVKCVLTGLVDFSRFYINLDVEDYSASVGWQGFFTAQIGVYNHPTGAFAITACKTCGNQDYYVDITRHTDDSVVIQVSRQDGASMLRNFSIWSNLRGMNHTAPIDVDNLNDTTIAYTDDVDDTGVSVTWTLRLSI